MRRLKLLEHSQAPLKHSWLQKKEPLISSLIHRDKWVSLHDNQSQEIRWTYCMLGILVAMVGVHLDKTHSGK